MPETDIELQAQLQAGEAERAALGATIRKLRKQLSAERAESSQRIDALEAELLSAKTAAAAPPPHSSGPESEDDSDRDPVARDPPPPPPSPGAVRRLRAEGKLGALPAVYRDLVRQTRRRQEAESKLAALQPQQPAGHTSPRTAHALAHLHATLARTVCDVQAGSMPVLRRRYPDLPLSAVASLSQQLLDSAADQLRASLPESYSHRMPADLRTGILADPECGLPLDESSGARLALELLLEVVSTRMGHADLVAAECHADGSLDAAEGGAPDAESSDVSDDELLEEVFTDLSPAEPVV